MNKPKCVFFLIGTLAVGGAERTVSNVTLNLPDSIEKKIVLYGTHQQIDYPHAGEILYIDRVKYNSPYNKWLTIPVRVQKLKRIKREFPEATYISFLEYPNLLNLLSKSRQKTIISVRNHMSAKHHAGYRAIFWNLMIKRFYSRADQIVAVSQDIKQDMVDHYGLDPDKIRVIYNYYQLETIKALAQESLPETDEALFKHPVIITVGRLSRQKGQYHLIRAFAQVHKERPDAHLVILGRGRFKEKLQQLADALGVGQAVHFPGFQSNPFQYIARAKVFVLPSFHEGFPNALAEAMACGVPVVSTDCHSGPREILAPNEFGQYPVSYGIDQSRFGVLVPVDTDEHFNAEDQPTQSEQKMSEAMLELLNSPALCDYFAGQSLRRIQAFDLKNIMQEWEALI